MCRRNPTNPLRYITFTSNGAFQDIGQLWMGLSDSFDSKFKSLSPIIDLRIKEIIILGVQLYAGVQVSIIEKQIFFSLIFHSRLKANRVRWEGEFIFHRLVAKLSCRAMPISNKPSLI